jgi:ketosteroid isomerase-like protein
VVVHARPLFGDVAGVEGTFTGTNTGDINGPPGDVAPTGRRVSLGYVQVLRFRDGKHASFNLMFDRLLMLEQLGLVAAPSARAYSG